MRTKTKVLQFSLGAAKGGIVMYMLNVWNFIDKEMFQFDFVTFAKHLNYEDEIIRKGSKIHRFSCYPEEDENRFIDELKRILSDNRYDVMEIHTSLWKSTVVERTAREMGVPKIIIHAHNSNIGISTRYPTKEAADKAIRIHDTVKNTINASMATDFWACSKVASKWLFEPQIDESQILILYNTIDTDRFRYSEERRNSLRNQLGFQNDLVIGYVGRLDASKNVLFLTEVLKELAVRRPDSKLLIVGAGVEKEEMERELVEYGIREKAHFAGRVDNVEDYLQAMDAFLLPSFYEGFPIALLEAQCAGLLCFASDKVTEEINITNQVAFLPAADPGTWAIEIAGRYGKADRYDRSSELKEKGFCTSERIRELEKLYLS